MARYRRGRPIRWAGLLLILVAAAGATGKTTERDTGFRTASSPSRRVWPLRLRFRRRATVTMEVTAYCRCRECCGRNARGITASGQKVSYNKQAFVAADTSVLPFYTRVTIPGYNQGRPVPVYRYRQCDHRTQNRRFLPFSRTGPTLGQTDTGSEDRVPRRHAVIAPIPRPLDAPASELARPCSSLCAAKLRPAPRSPVASPHSALV